MLKMDFIVHTTLLSVKLQAEKSQLGPMNECVFVELMLSKPRSVLTIPTAVVSVLYHGHELWFEEHRFRAWHSSRVCLRRTTGVCFSLLILYIISIVCARVCYLLACAVFMSDRLM